MTFNEYQKFTATTAIYDRARGLEYTILGLAGEAGEVAGKLSKVIRDNDGKLNEETRMALGKELGDVLWFISEAATVLGYELEHVADANKQKLQSRQQRNVLTGSGDNR